MRDICKVMGLEGQLWSEFMKHGQPKMVCPFKKTTYKITEAVVDLGYVAHLPLDGYKWTFIIKTFKSIKGRKKKQMIFCEAFDITITRTRSGRKRIEK